MAALAVGGVVLTVLGQGGPKRSPGQTPKPGIPGQPAPAPNGQSLAERYPGLTMIDMRDKAPKDQIVEIRGLENTTAAVLHQTDFFGWKDSNPLWPKVRSHFVVRQDGRVQINYDPEVRMTTGSNAANKFAVTIEHEGNFANANGNFYKPEKFGKSYLKEHPAQVEASRRLLAALKAMAPNMTAVFAHRQWADQDRSNCPGPEIWQAIGEWAKKNLGLTDGGPGWKYDPGQAIPDSWRAPLVA